MAQRTEAIYQGKVLGGYGHLTYSVKCQPEYVKLLKKICNHVV